MIDSALVSAQSRKRYYWANWEITQPEDRGLLLKDIIEDGACDREKSYCIDANYYKGGNPKSYFEKGRRQLVELPKSARRGAMVRKVGNVNPSGRGMNGCVYDTEGKSPTVTTNKGEGTKVGNITEYRKLTPIECERLQTLPDGYTSGISNTQRYKCSGNGWTVEVIAHIFRCLKNALTSV
jgi:site-specific DNA-cytosine methylase